MGLPMSEVFMREHRESISCCFIEAGRAGVRLQPAVTLPPLSAHGQPPAEPSPSASPTGEPEYEVTTYGLAMVGDPQEAPQRPNGDERPTTIPLAGGLPCGGKAIATLKPGALSMLRSKVASLIHAEGDQWVPLLSALEAERQRRLAPGHVRLVEPVPEAAEEARALDAIAQAMAPTTKEAEIAEPDRETAARQRWAALSRRSMKAGLSATVWESLRAGPYEAAERVVMALESAPAGRA
jgi:hypothetical protein